MPEMTEKYDDYFLTLLALDAYNRGDFVNVVLPEGAGNSIGSAVARDYLGSSITVEQMSDYLGENNYSLFSAKDVGFNAVT